MIHAQSPCVNKKNLGICTPREDISFLENRRILPIAFSFFFLKEIIEYLPALVIGECKRLCSRLKDFRSYREKQAMSNIVNSGKAILNRGTKR